MLLKHRVADQWIFTDNYSFAIFIKDEGESFFGRIFHTSDCKIAKSSLLLALRVNTSLIAKVQKKLFFL